MEANSGALVLVVDDHQGMAKRLKEMVERAGFCPTLAFSGREAIEAFAAAQSAGAPFRAVITDFSMDDTDGLAVAAAVKRTSPSTVVIVMTAYATDAADRLPANVDAMMTKIPHDDVLRSTLVRLLES